MSNTTYNASRVCFSLFRGGGEGRGGGGGGSNFYLKVGGTGQSSGNAGQPIATILGAAVFS